MPHRKPLLKIVALAAFAAALLFLARAQVLTRAQDDAPPTAQVTQSSPVAASPATNEVHSDRAGKSQDGNADDAEFIAALRGKFGEVIHVKHAQIKLLEQVMAYLQARYPQDWRDRVYDTLMQLFPELAGDLYAKFQSLNSYNQSLHADRERLRAMSPEQRREALWAKRYAAFGSDAEAIWAAELRNQQIHDTLTWLNGADNVNTAEKLNTFIDAVNTAYGDNSEHFIRSRQTELINRFLAVESVQSDLRAMPAEQRRDMLREIRSEMGMDSAAVDRWEALDRKRDQTWQAGQLYMARRSRILQQYSGAAQEQRIHALREELFGQQAETIQQEEQAGFFRFDRKRRIGKE